MEKPTGLRTLDLAAAAGAPAAAEPGGGVAVEAAEAPSAAVCSLAMSAYNSAHRGKLAYQALAFFMAIAVVVAAIYALTSFKDDKTAAGFLGLVSAVGSLVTTGVIGTLAKSAADDEKAMWERVQATCL